MGKHRLGAKIACLMAIKLNYATVSSILDFATMVFDANSFTENLNSIRSNIKISLTKLSQIQNSFLVMLLKNREVLDNRR